MCAQRPDEGAELLTTVNTGMIFPVREVQGSWVKIQVTTNVEGFVHADYVSVAQGLTVGTPIEQEEALQADITSREEERQAAAEEAAARKEAEASRNQSSSSSSSSGSSGSRQQFQLGQLVRLQQFQFLQLWLAKPGDLPDHCLLCLFQVQRRQLRYDSLRHHPRSGIYHRGGYLCDPHGDRGAD